MVARRNRYWSLLPEYSSRDAIPCQRHDLQFMLNADMALVFDLESHLLDPSNGQQAFTVDSCPASPPAIGAVNKGCTTPTCVAV